MNQEHGEDIEKNIDIDMFVEEKLDITDQIVNADREYATMKEQDDMNVCHGPAVELIKLVLK